MSINKRKTILEMTGVNNMCILKNGNLHLKNIEFEKEVSQ